MGNKFEIAA